MKAILPILASLAVLATGCSKCKCDDPNPDEYTSGNGLPGNWKLVDLQCYCAPAPLPNQRLAITATGFTEYQNGAQTSSATYTIGSATLCGIPGATPALHLVPRVSTGYNSKVGYTLNGDTLVLDYGSPCDAPRKTYRRVR
jgi:hypothetical protein